MLGEGGPRLDAFPAEEAHGLLRVVGPAVAPDRAGRKGGELTRCLSCALEHCASLVSLNRGLSH